MKCVERVFSTGNQSAAIRNFEQMLIQFREMTANSSDYHLKLFTLEDSKIPNIQDSSTFPGPMMKEISKLIVPNLATGVKFPFSKSKQDMKKKRDITATRDIN